MHSNASRSGGAGTTVSCGLRPVLPKLGPLQEDGRQRCSYTFDHLMSAWVRIAIQLPPQRCTGDGFTLRQPLDTRLPGTSQGCTPGQPRARRDHPVSQVSMGKSLNVRLNRRENQPAKAGCQAWSKRTRSPAHRLLLLWNTPHGPGGQHAPHETQNGPQERRNPTPALQGTGRPLEQGVTRKPALGRDGSQSQGRGESPRIC